MSRCLACGSTMSAPKKETRKYDCGLDNNVQLIDVEVRHCPKCGEEDVGIREIEALNCQIAAKLIMKEAALIPEEIRFLRTYLGLSSKVLAAAMGVTAETVSRWERVDAPLAMKKSMERFLRLMVANEKPVGDYRLGEMSESANSSRSPLKLKVRQLSSGGWRVEA